jgi:hypothetical protein
VSDTARERAERRARNILNEQMLLPPQVLELARDVLALVERVEAAEGALRRQRLYCRECGAPVFPFPKDTVAAVPVTEPPPPEAKDA